MSMFGSRAVGRWKSGVLGRNFGVEREGRLLPYRIWQAIIACLQVLSNLWRTNRMPIRIKAQTGRCAGSTWWPNPFGVVMPTSIGSFLSRHVFRPRTRFQLEVRHGQLKI